MTATTAPSAPSPVPAAAAEHPYQLHCMEIWGGNEPVVQAFSMPGIDVWVHARPHGDDAGGGDLHYLSMCGGGNISRLALADVAGHGHTVADLAVSLRKLMRKHINTPNQARFARALNEEFSDINADGRFATALLATYFAPTDHLIICNAGHPRPLWFHAATGQWELLKHDSPQCADAVRNLPLGVIEPTDYVQFAVNLGKGDIVFIYSDALIEAQSPTGKQLGERGLLELACTLDPADIPTLGDRLLAAVAAHRAQAPAKDDETLITLHHNAADPPPFPIGERLRVIAKMLGLMKV